MYRIKHLILIFLFFSFTFNAVSREHPAIEIRAVWLTTNWGLDWPSQNKSVEQQKAELRNMLDELRKLNFNVVFFQTRARGAVLYNSKIEPKSTIYNRSGNFDPLAFTIEECHKRGMECHAWIVTFPMGSERKPVAKKKQKALLANKPDNYRLVNNIEWYLDPGHPKTNEHIVSIVKEIVTNYDVDGVQFDYIRYPNNDRKFPDEVTYKKYGNGKSLYDWRRDNINRLVTNIYDTVKSIKPWVQVSSSPLGRYQPLPHNPNDGWTARETVFQDAAQWLKEGKHDLLFPMMYYKDNLFFPFVDDWIANSNDRPIVPGLGTYQMMNEEKKWPLSDITKQMTYTRENKAAGQAYFRAKNITTNLKGLKDSLQVFYPYQAKLPPLKWLDNVAPNSPLDMQVYLENDMLNIEWTGPEETEGMTYTVYYSKEEQPDVTDPRFILATRVKGNKIQIPIRRGEFGFYYSVTASDRFHNESVPCFAAYFSHSENEQ